MLTTVRPAFIASLFAILALSGCDKAPAGEEKKEAAATSSEPCAGGGEALSGIAILEVKDVPDEPEAGAKLVRQLKEELTAECVAKGLDKSATEALTCYEKNKGKAGYRVLKGCDEKPGRALLDAVVAKHGGKR